MENKRGDLTIVTLSLLVLFVTISTLGIFLLENNAVKEEIVVGAIINDVIPGENSIYFYLEENSKIVLREMYAEADSNYSKFLDSFSVLDFDEALKNRIGEFDSEDDAVLKRIGSLIEQEHLDSSLDEDVLSVGLDVPVDLSGGSGKIRYVYSKEILLDIDLGFLAS